MTERTELECPPCPANYLVTKAHKGLMCVLYFGNFIFHSPLDGEGTFIVVLV